MTVADGFRLWFLGLYALGTLATLVMIVRVRAQRDAVEAQEGPVPSPGILIPLGVPALVLLTRVGEIGAGWLPLRWAAAGLSLYFLVMLPWMLLTLGRFAVPGAGILRDHELVTSGPFRFVRHPLYSGALVLWLTAALGTWNWLLLALWPLFLIIVVRLPVREEERLLHDKFGPAYDDYRRRTGRLVPRFGRLTSSEDL
jgi:protein-S-isoprenylcysteine O-methyltransferase Ste14